MSQLLDLIRRLAGMPDYAGYVAHLRRCHPERAVPSEREFFADYLAARYGDGPTPVLLMKRFLGYFLNGLLFSAPIALTLYVCYRVFRAVDSWLNLPVPGTGFIATLAIITLVGYLASTFLWKTLFSFVEEAMGRLPFVRYLYTALKDVLGAFVGERRRFDKPVMVTLTADGHARALGFLTQESLQRLGLGGMVAVYLPQSYNFAGQLLLFPAGQVAPVIAPSSDVMAFIVSGGVVDVAERERAARPTPAT